MKRIACYICAAFAGISWGYGLFEWLHYIFTGAAWNPLGVDANRLWAWLILSWCVGGAALLLYLAEDWS